MQFSTGFTLLLIFRKVVVDIVSFHNIMHFCACYSWPLMSPTDVS